MIKINIPLINDVSGRAKVSPRKRQNYNFHGGDNAVFHRMLNALEPGTYARPHRHLTPLKDETFVILRGKVLALEFDDKGNILDHALLDAQGDNKGVEFRGGSWHTLIALESGSCVLEMKEGPYDKETDKVFGDWSPREGDPRANEYVEGLLDRAGIKVPNG